MGVGGAPSSQARLAGPGGSQFHHWTTQAGQLVGWPRPPAPRPSGCAGRAAAGDSAGPCRGMDETLPAPQAYPSSAGGADPGGRAKELTPGTTCCYLGFGNASQMLTQQSRQPSITSSNVATSQKLAHHPRCKAPNTARMFFLGGFFYSSVPPAPVSTLCIRNAKANWAQSRCSSPTLSRSCPRTASSRGVRPP